MEQIVPMAVCTLTMKKRKIKESQDGEALKQDWGKTQSRLVITSNDFFYHYK